METETSKKKGRQNRHLWANCFQAQEIGGTLDVTRHAQMVGNTAAPRRPAVIETSVLLFGVRCPLLSVEVCQRPVTMLIFFFSLVFTHSYK